MTRNITFFFRNGGIIVSQIENDNHTAQNIGQRMSAGGFISATDSFWGKTREVVINLADVSVVILTSAQDTKPIS